MRVGFLLLGLLLAACEAGAGVGPRCPAVPVGDPFQVCCTVLPSAQVDCSSPGPGLDAEGGRYLPACDDGSTYDVGVTECEEGLAGWQPVCPDRADAPFCLYVVDPRAAP